MLDLTLGAGNGHGVFDALQVAPPDGEGRQGVVIPSHYLGTHTLKGLYYSPHGAGTQRIISGQHRGERLGSQETGQKPHGSTAVVRVQNILRLLKLEAGAIHYRSSRFLTRFNADAHCFQATHGGKNIFSGGKTGEPCSPKAIEFKSSARWEMDLSPGTERSPPKKLGRLTVWRNLAYLAPTLRYRSLRVLESLKNRFRASINLLPLASVPSPQ